MERGNSSENPKKLIIVGGNVEARGNDIVIPSERAGKKELPSKGRTMPEGEMVINVGIAKYNRDENGKIVNVEFIEAKDASKEDAIR